MATLNESAAVTLATVSGVVTGFVTIGPGLNGFRGPANWVVDGVIVRTSRPGVAPIPRVEVVDQLGVAQGVSYDGSYDQGGCNIPLGRGEFITVTWTGGTAGDIATATVSGTMS